jgi:glycosyltransferase 2 family protein
MGRDVMGMSRDSTMWSPVIAALDLTPRPPVLYSPAMPSHEQQAAADVDPPASRSRGIAKVAMFAAKFVVTAVCFWYLSRRIDFAEALRTLPVFDIRWAAFAVLLAMLQLPLLGLRWCEILDALALRNSRITRTAVMAVTAIGAFFTQVLPNVASEGMRVWLLARLGCDWRSGVVSVLIDRGVGVGLMVAFAFGVLLVPSALTALAGYRSLVLAVYGALLVAAVLALILTPFFAPVLQRWRYTRWLATFAIAARRVLLGPRGATILGVGCAVHALTIAIIWSLGRAQGLTLPVLDAAVLFTVMIGIALIPVSIGGWGLRELAVVALLGGHGVAPERALLFSVCFGLVLVIGALPGALVWLLYPIPPSPVK